MNGFFDKNRTLTVSQFNSVVKSILENDELLVGVTVCGEISNFKAYPSGHFYFTLKDAGSALNCVMFSFDNRMLRFRPNDGMQVRVRGQATVYVKDGRYQFVVKNMEADGAGGLYAAYEQLKKKLEAEGLFDEAKKKKLPFFPHRVGVITSSAGAAYRDILNVTGRRFPCAEILLYPSLVQGAEAPANLIKGVEYFTRTRCVDVLIIGRGGGSIEDLWAFNDEALARTLAACPIPTISAVGHETDFTICDFVCDKRAPTPSAAAELAVPDRQALLQGLLDGQIRMKNALDKGLNDKKSALRRLAESKALTDRQTALRVKKEASEALAARFYREILRNTEKKREKFSLLCGKMTSLNPMAVLGRGYGAIFDENGNVVKSVRTLKKDDVVSLRLSDGEARAKVFETKEDKGNG